VELVAREALPACVRADVTDDRHRAEIRVAPLLVDVHPLASHRSATRLAEQLVRRKFRQARTAGRRRRARRRDVLRALAARQKRDKCDEQDRNGATNSASHARGVDRACAR
jgi:hypothetical protein